MDLIRILYKISKRTWLLYHLFIYFFIKKPLWHFCFNQGGNRFICHGLMLNCSVKINGCYNALIIDKNVVLNNVQIEISGNCNNLVIHDGVKFFEGGRVMLKDSNNMIEIGEKTEFVSCFFVVCDNNHKVIIGKNCMFSVNVMIRTSDQHSILNESNERINPAKDVIVHDRVWVGYGATILKGCVLEEDSIVGTESVVASMHVPKNSVVAGNPAKIVKQGVHWRKERL